MDNSLTRIKGLFKWSSFKYKYVPTWNVLSIKGMLGHDEYSIFRVLDFAAKKVNNCSNDEMRIYLFSFNTFFLCVFY